MKTITGILIIYALAVPSAPAAAQGDDIGRSIERIVDNALTLAADALDNLVDERAARQRGERGRGGQGPEYTETFTKTVRLGRDGRLELENLSGDVDVTGGGGDDVKIVATKVIHSTNESAARASLVATQIAVTERPGQVAISSEPTRGRFGGVEVNYVITMPAGTSLSLKTYSGDVSIKNIGGEVQLNSLSGDIVIKESKPRAIDISSVSGDVSLEQVDSDRVQVNSISGDITLTGKLSKTGRYELRSNSGDIQVVPEGNPGFEIEAGTFSGDVSSDFALKLRGTAGNSFGSKGPKRNNDIRGTVNDGGALLSLHSFSGDILISKR